MQTAFTKEQLADPKIAYTNTILRKCVHCGFCTATCPTYVHLGDELDSPRGRIYLMKEMLEQGKPADKETVKHIDRCLSCLSCMTTCPSGVNYMHLVDQARAHIEDTYQRPLSERMIRKLLAVVMPNPRLFRFSLIAARLALPFRPAVQAFGFHRLAAMLDLTPKSLPRPQLTEGKATHAKRGRVGLLRGCVQSVLDPEINAATIRLLIRLGVEVVVPDDVPCCGSLTHHMGKTHDALARARASIDQWLELGIETVIITASGCGTTVKDYGHMLQHDVQYADKAARVSAMAKDVTEFLASLSMPEGRGEGRVTYHSACSMQHGQGLKTVAQGLLRQAGFEVREVPDGHLCCGSAGTYNILQPEIAAKLRAAKLVAINSTSPDIVATGNIGCITQLASGLSVPVVHTIELLDWAYGGPKPTKLDHPLA